MGHPAAHAQTSAHLTEESEREWERRCVHGVLWSYFKEPESCPFWEQPLTEARDWVLHVPSQRILFRC